MAKLIIQQRVRSPAASFNHMKVLGKVPCPRGPLGSRGPKEGWHQVTSRGGTGHLRELCWPQSPCPAAVTDCSTLSLAVKCLYILFYLWQGPGARAMQLCFGLCLLPPMHRAGGGIWGFQEGNSRAAVSVLGLQPPPKAPQAPSHRAQPHTLLLNNSRSHPTSP